MVNSLGTGVSDFFYLPAKGAVESPEQFGIGLAKGSLSLVKGTISGIFGSVGSITGSMSKGLAVASVRTCTRDHSHTRCMRGCRGRRGLLWRRTERLFTQMAVYVCCVFASVCLSDGREIHREDGHQAADGSEERC